MQQELFDRVEADESLFFHFPPNVAAMIDREISRKTGLTESFCKKYSDTLSLNEENMKTLLIQAIAISPAKDPAADGMERLSRVVNYAVYLSQKQIAEGYMKELGVDKAYSRFNRSDIAMKRLTEDLKENYYGLSSRRKKIEEDIVRLPNGKEVEGPSNRLFQWGKTLEEYLNESDILPKGYTEAMAKNEINNFDYTPDAVDFTLADGFVVRIGRYDEMAQAIPLQIIRPVFEGEDSNATEKGNRVTIHADWKVSKYEFASSEQMYYNLIKDMKNDFLKKKEESRFLYKAEEAPVKEEEINSRNEGTHYYVPNQWIDLGDAIYTEPHKRADNGLFEFFPVDQQDLKADNTGTTDGRKISDGNKTDRKEKARTFRNPLD